MNSTVLYISSLALILSCRNEGEKVVNTEPVDTALDRIDADGDGWLNMDEVGARDVL